MKNLLITALLLALSVPTVAQPSTSPLDLNRLRSDPDYRAAAEQRLNAFRDLMGSYLMNVAGSAAFVGMKCNYYVGGETELRQLVTDVARNQEQERDFIKIYERAKSGEVTMAGHLEFSGRLEWEYGIRMCNASFVIRMKDAWKATDLFTSTNVLEVAAIAKVLRSLR